MDLKGGVGGVILALITGAAAAQTAPPEAPTNVGDVRWGATLAELQKVRANAKCHIEYEERSPVPGQDEQTAQYDLERGLVITRVRFRATCFDSFQDADASFLLEGNPPKFHKAYITYRNQDYTALRETLIKMYGQPSERDAPARARWRWWWPAAPAHDPERLIWRRPHATVTLYSSEYEQRGGKIASPMMVIESPNRPSQRDGNAPVSTVPK